MRLVRFENVQRVTRYINADLIMCVKADGEDVTEIKMLNGDVCRVKGSLAATVKTIKEACNAED